MRVIISSLPKSGTVLTANSVANITGLIDFHDEIKKEIVKNNIDVTVNGLIFKNNKLHANIIHLDKEKLEKKVYLYNINNKIYFFNNYYFITHSNIEAFQELVDKFKIIVNVRNIFNYIHSYMKTIHPSKHSYEIRKRVQNRENYLKVMYLTPSFLANIVELWKSFVNIAIKYQKKIYINRYEDLVFNSETTFKNIGLYFDINLSKEKLEKLKKELLFKELTNLDDKHKYHSHYNGTMKNNPNEWMDYIPKELFEKIYGYVEKELTLLGYNNIEYIDSKNEFKENMNLKYRNFDIASYRWDYYLSNLKEKIKNKRVAFYGYGFYAQELIKLLNISPEIIFDDYNKQCKRIEEILNYINKFDILLIAVNPIFQDKLYYNTFNNLLHCGDIEIINAFDYNLNSKIYEYIK